MYYLETGNAKQARFRNAVLLALAVHAALVLSISFSADRKKPYTTPQIEVTLASRPNATAPDDAQNLAQANQLGSGDESDINQISSRDRVQSSTPSKQQFLMPAPREQTTQHRDVVTTTATASRIASRDDTQAERQRLVAEGINPEVDLISRKLASLQAELDEKTRAHARQPRVRRLTAASAKQSVDAAYLLDWRRRLEAVGNQYYPQASIRYGIYGDLRMLVVIRQDGSLEDIQVLSSSGYAVLDEAAIKIVRMAAPFAPFPPELAATTDKLEIVRTWHFQENELSSP
ncbi:MAG: energy transducer TonB [Halioglobus sp.]